MLVYEHDRTKDIVNRLVKVAPVVRFLTIFFLIVVLATLFALLTYVLITDAVVLVIAAGLGGGLLGLILGFLLSAVFNILLEWMAQMLVAQGAIVSQLRKKNKV